MGNCIGTVLTLKGRSKKGKERITQYGDKWEIMEVCLNKDEHMRLRIKSLPNTPNSDHRWIQCGHDKDFEIVGF